jgi:ferrous iron transport protein B
VNQNKNTIPQIAVAIVGLPNTGKTQVFNNLTGEYGLVSNYPSTTVTEKVATVRIDGRMLLVIDTPGFHGLYADSEEELYVRNLLVERKPDIILQCIDANRLKQSLYLTAQLVELEIPMLISLNIVDETAKNGKIVDSVTLSRALGIPVVECVATEGKGTAALKHALGRAAIGTSRVEYFPHYERYADEIGRVLPPNAPLPRLTTRLILQKDRFVLTTGDWLPGEQGLARLREIVRDAWSTFDGNFNKAINHSITKWIDGIESRVVSSTQTEPGRFSEIASRASRHPIWGIPIVLLFSGSVIFPSCTSRDR